MIIDNVISAPIAFPIIEPIDWARWWKLWTTEAVPAKKIATTHNSTGGPWIGMNVYIAPGIDNKEYTGYDIKNVICPELFPTLFDNLESFPIDIAVMQIVSSRYPSPPHTDHNEPRISVRTMLYDNNFTPTFYYVINGEKRYQTLPDNTNTWIYHDNKYRHGSDHYNGHSKHLIIYHGKIKRGLLENNLVSCNDTYKDYIIKDDNALPPNS